MKNFLIAIFMALIFLTNVSANSAVLGLGLDSCVKVIKNVEKMTIWVRCLRLPIHHM